MKTHEILYQTLAQAQDYVNGEQLAQEMGLSRTSIWKAIQRLEKRWGRHRVPQKEGLQTGLRRYSAS